MKRFSFPGYLLIMGIVTCVMAVIYTAAQQTYRASANDPQMQIACDINTKLSRGKPVDNFFTDTIDIATSLSAFATLYNASGKPIRSSGYLDDYMIQLPAEVFDFARSSGHHEITWEPGNGVRMAVVVLKSDASTVGFVAVGRSLQETEIREHNLVTVVFLGWLLCLALVLIHAVFQFYQNRQPNN